MKPGDTFEISNAQLLEPWEGHLVIVTLEGGQVVKARIEKVFLGSTKLKAVPDSTLE